MAKKQFKAESKRLLDLMINSIYTNKEIFLRELISNASDAIDKVYFRSLTDKSLDIKHSDLLIRIEADKENRLLKISDNGIGMTSDELEKNLGTIARSGTFDFKNENNNDENKIDEDKFNLIGQFGVGFYSSFMVSDKVTVLSKSIDSEKAYKWESEGADGYQIIETDEIKDRGTTVILHLKEDNDDENYSKFLDEYDIEALIKKYSDYIRYPIKMEIEHKSKKEGSDEEEITKEDKTLNSLIPIWKKDKKDITEDDYKNFYVSKFYDFEEPLKWIHMKVEGQYSFSALLYIPSHLPYDYYTKDFKRGLSLYSNGVMIMENEEKLLPDYFSFVKGIVDSEDVSLNISREMLQQDKSLKVICKNIENKVKTELLNMLKNDREKYEKFFGLFGMQLKAGAYDGYGINKDKLVDLLLFHSSINNEKSDYLSLDEYVEKMKENQKEIYYASGESLDKIKMLPQVQNVLDKGFNLLYLDENIDEFCLQIIENYKEKKFVNISSNNLDLDSDEEKEELKKKNEEFKDMFNLMKEAVGDSSIKEIKFTHRLKEHPVCLISEGVVSSTMQKVLNMMPDQKDIKADTVLEINENHPIAEKITTLYKEDKKDELKNYSKILLNLAKLIEGLPIDNPTELSNMICKFI